MSKAVAVPLSSHLHFTWTFLAEQDSEIKLSASCQMVRRGRCPACRIGQPLEPPRQVVQTKNPTSYKLTLATTVVAPYLMQAIFYPAPRSVVSVVSGIR
jgi:hypothetical protein